SRAACVLGSPGGALLDRKRPPDGSQGEGMEGSSPRILTPGRGDAKGRVACQAAELRANPWHTTFFPLTIVPLRLAPHGLSCVPPCHLQWGGWGEKSRRNARTRARQARPPRIAARTRGQGCANSFW